MRISCTSYICMHAPQQLELSRLWREASARHNGSFIQPAIATIACSPGTCAFGMHCIHGKHSWPQRLYGLPGGELSEKTHRHVTSSKTFGLTLQSESKNASIYIGKHYTKGCAASGNAPKQQPACRSAEQVACRSPRARRRLFETAARLCIVCRCVSSVRGLELFPTRRLPCGHTWGCEVGRQRRYPLSPGTATLLPTVYCCMPVTRLPLCLVLGSCHMMTI